MYLSALNLDIVWKDPMANFQKIETEMASCPSADLILLPEMFATGFCMQPEAIADRQNETLCWLQEMAGKYRTAFAGGASVYEGGKYFNRCYFVFPDGQFQFYDKRHLFSYSGEDAVYTAGQERVVVAYNGVRFLLQTCYDLRFPVFSRNQQDYDAILYLANFPQKRVEAWRTLLKARAIENQAYVFGVNRIGTDGNALYYEESTDCYFADGHIVSHKEGYWVRAELDMEALKNFRGRFKFLDDADDFSLHLH